MEYLEDWIDREAEKAIHRYEFELLIGKNDLNHPSLNRHTDGYSYELPSTNEAWILWKIR